MKLIDLLVKELPRRGGWPEGVTHIGQDYDRELRFYGRGEPGTGITLDELAVDHRKIGASDKGVTKSQYDSALAASDGWIEWNGGECPVDSDAIVEVRYWNQNQNQYRYNNDRAGDFEWSHTDSYGDIIAYRVHDKGINHRANDDRLEQDLNECIGQDVDIPEWNGEGLPPVGVECELKCATGEWVVVEITAIARNGVCFVERGKNGENYAPFRVEFRPLRTEEEMVRDKLAASLHIAAGASPIELNGIGRLYFKLADAIISGSIFGTTFKAGK